MAPLFAYDSETFLIRPGLQAPPMVCVQFAVDDAPEELIHVRDPAARQAVEWALRTALVSGHNVAYDMVCICAQWPELTPLVFQAYMENRVVCTTARQKLLEVAWGCSDFKTGGWYSLAESTARLVPGFAKDAKDPWRFKYGTLYNTPVADWPLEALEYALKDATGQRLLHRAQDQAETHGVTNYVWEGDIPPMPGILEDQFRQARAGFWIMLMRAWGIRTEREQVEKFHAQVVADLERDRVVCVQAGLVRGDGSRFMKAAMGRMVEIHRLLGDPPPLSDGGRSALETLRQTNPMATAFDVWDQDQAKAHPGVSLDEDACLASADDLLMAFQRYGAAKTTLGKVERLFHGIDLPLQADFQVMVETGRTSCRQGERDNFSDEWPDRSPSAWGTQLQNPPRSAEDHEATKAKGKPVYRPGIRECFIPRREPRVWPGYASAPFTAGSLFCSTDWDGAELKAWSQVCLWAVGFSSMSQVLNEGGDVHTEVGALLDHITVADAYAIMEGKHGLDRKRAFKDRPRQVGKIFNFGFPGGMGHVTLRVQARKEYRVILSEEECKNGRAVWKHRWAEAQPYFDWINSLLVGDRDNAYATVQQFVSKRVRGHVRYTEAANGFFQALIADAAKDAGFRLAYEMYTGQCWDTRRPSPLAGCRKVNFLHDEFITEVPDHPERAHLAGERQAEIMRKTAAEWMPDLKHTAAPALMRRWSKNAEPYYVNGLLTPYEDKPT